MAGQIWTVAGEGGFAYSDELSDYMRIVTQQLTKFRQFCDAPDGEQKGLNRGDLFHWNVYTNIGTQGRQLDERQAMPEGGFTILQRTLTITEAGMSVPFTGKLMDLAKHDIMAIINQTLKNDARKFFDIQAFLQFKQTVLRAAPTAGTSLTSVTVSTGGSTAITNNVGLNTGHIKALSDYAKEANIPPFKDDDYMMISRPTTYRPFKNTLEGIKQYTVLGIAEIFAGEIGRYENTRFIEQTFIPAGGSDASVLFDPYAQVADPWTNGLSSWAFLFGADTVTEAIALPEEIRAKIPDDYGRSRGVAWYYLGGFGICHPDAANAKIVMWDSAT